MHILLLLQHFFINNGPWSWTGGAQHIDVPMAAMRTLDFAALNTGFSLMPLHPYRQCVLEVHVWLIVWFFLWTQICGPNLFPLHTSLQGWETGSKEELGLGPAPFTFGETLWLIFVKFILYSSG
jgi:hypothetical protein